jgi:hypothetical protein
MEECGLGFGRVVIAPVKIPWVGVASFTAYDVLQDVPPGNQSNPPRLYTLTICILVRWRREELNVLFCSNIEDRQVGMMKSVKSKE